MDFASMHPRDQIVAIMNRIYYGGMTTLSGGNLSILDENGDLWITPAGMDKGRLSAQDIVCIHADGTIEGAHRPSTETPFHRAIYARRPDLHAVVHAHAPALVSFSTARQIPDTCIIPQAQRVCGTVGYAPYALPGSEQLGANIATTFAEGYNVVLLENHGIAVAGVDILSAFQRLETLEFCARTLIKARTLGTVRNLSDQQLSLFDNRVYRLPEFEPAAPSDQESALRHVMVDMVHRACSRQLMTSSEGVMSARIDANSFLITPTDKDRSLIDEEDVVLIRDGKREAGKLPSRSVMLHHHIYETHPEINCVISGQPPHMMAYSVTGTRFNSETIPESYFLLLEVPFISFDMFYQHPENTADIIGKQAPVVVVENDCVITTGGTVLQAFDRLEVAEFSARALLDTQSIGPMIPIGDEDLEALRKAFLS